MINCIIVEDEHLAAAKLSDFISKVGRLSLTQTFENGASATAYLLTNKIDLIFLDINMPGINGMQIMKSLVFEPKIIITSAESGYALTGYQYNVSDYLLKPFSFDRFVKAVAKVIQEIDRTHQPEPTYIFVKAAYKIERIDLDEISYVEGMKDYLSIVLPDRKLMTLMSFAEILQLLPATRFMRVHKSFVVSLSKIRSIDKSYLLIGNRSIPVSNSYREAFITHLKKSKNIL